MIAIIPERVIGMPRNTDRHRPESPSCRIIVNFSQNITSKSLKISHRIFLISPKKSGKSRSLDRSWNQRLKWRDFDVCIRMKTNVLLSSPVAQR